MKEKPESLMAVHTLPNLNKYLKKLYSKKEEFATYGIILLICIMLCAPLLQMHIASDTYNFMDLGYFEYPSQYFIKDARIISALVTYLAGMLNLSYETFIIGMEILAVIISAFSVYYIYRTVRERAKLTNNLQKVLVIMASFILVFNCMSLEYLLYAECSIMCLSLLLSIISARIFTSNSTKHRILKSTLIMILSTFCYQGAVNIFLPLSILFLFIDSNKKMTKELVKKILMACIVIIASYLINVISIYMFNMILGVEQQRIGGGIFSNLSNFAIILKNVIEFTLINNFNLWPTGITIIFIVISLILLLFQKDTTREIVQYLVLIVASMGICVAPIFFMQSPSIEPRMSMSIGGIVDMSLIYLITSKQDYNIIKNILSVITILFFVYNAINTIQIYTVHIATNKIDANMGIAIKYKIEEYEQETGNIVTKVGYYRDASHRDFHYGWNKKYSSFAQRAFDNYYCIIEALNYYCDKDFERVGMDAEIYNKYFKGKNWQAYSDEQIVFVDDTMYICTY